MRLPRILQRGTGHDEPPETLEDLPEDSPDAHPVRHAPLSDPFFDAYRTQDNIDRQAAWRTRILLVAITCVSAVALCLAAVILLMLPLQRTIPYLVTFHQGGDRVVSLQPVAWSATTANLLRESEIRRYILERTQIVPVAQEMNLRWFSSDGFVPAHSTPDSYARFQSHAQQLWEDNVREPFTRITAIHSLVQQEPSLWRAEFSTSDDYRDPVIQDPRPIHWTAIIQTTSIRYRNPPTKRQLLRNPTGLLISDWHEQPIHSTDRN